MAPPAERSRARCANANFLPAPAHCALPSGAKSGRKIGPTRNRIDDAAKTNRLHVQLRSKTGPTADNQMVSELARWPATTHCAGRPASQLDNRLAAGALLSCKCAPGRSCGRALSGRGDLLARSRRPSLSPRRMNSRARPPNWPRERGARRKWRGWRNNNERQPVSLIQEFWKSARALASFAGRLQAGAPARERRVGRPICVGNTKRLFAAAARPAQVDTPRAASSEPRAERAPRLSVRPARVARPPACLGVRLGARTGKFCAPPRTSRPAPRPSKRAAVSG